MSFYEGNNSLALLSNRCNCYHYKKLIYEPHGQYKFVMCIQGFLKKLSNHQCILVRKNSIYRHNFKYFVKQNTCSVFLCNLVFKNILVFSFSLIRLFLTPFSFNSLTHTKKGYLWCVFWVCIEQVMLLLNVDIHTNSIPILQRENIKSMKVFSAH